MPLADLIIILIVSRGDLDGTCTEFHVDDDGIGDNGEAAIRDKRMLEEFSVKVLQLEDEHRKKAKRQKKGPCIEDHLDGRLRLYHQAWFRDAWWR